MLSKEKANKPAEDNNAPLLNSTNRQPTLSLLCQLKQQNKPDKFSPTVDSESISSNTASKPWESSNRQSNKNISCTRLLDHECLQSVLQNFSLPKNEKIESQKNKPSNPIQVSSTFYSSPEGPRISCLTSNMTQVQEDCISSSWEMPQGGPLGEILTNSKNTEDLTNKCESRSYGWLLNLEDHEMWILSQWRARHGKTHHERLWWDKQDEIALMFIPSMLLFIFNLLFCNLQLVAIFSSYEFGCILKKKSSLPDRKSVV